MTSPASADDAETAKIQCKAAYESAQVLKREGRFAATREQIAVCQRTCPATLVRECSSWAIEIDALAPTVRLSATDAGGRVVTDVRVLVDGAPITGPIDAPIAVDPGSHVFRFETHDGNAAEARAQLRIGERERLVAVTFPEHPASETSQRSRAPSFIAFGLGAALLATGGVLSIAGHLERSSLRSSCAPHCDESDVDAIRAVWWTAAGVAALGAIAIGAGVVLWPRSSSAALGISPRAISLVLTLP